MTFVNIIYEKADHHNLTRPLLRRYRDVCTTRL